jgi:hypothetical protein
LAIIYRLLTRIFSQDELEDLLQKDLTLTGSSYYATTWTCTPDPGLCIEGVGPTALPLNEEAAKAIIKQASHAPFGYRDKTLVDTKVRDTWEINPSKLRFGCQEWQSIVEEITKDVCQGLGVDQPTTRPRLELHKLLLYEPGSQSVLSCSVYYLELTMVS